MIKKILISLLSLSGITLFAITPQEIVDIINKKGVEVESKIINTPKIDLKSEKLYIDDNGTKIMLFKVINKTNETVNVEREINYGVATPRMLDTKERGWLIVEQNNNAPKEVTYVPLNVHDNLSNTFVKNGTKFLTNELQETKIYNINSKLDTIETNDKLLLNNLKLIENFTLIERVDIIVDEYSNRYGLYLTGFAKTNNLGIQPYSLYFIIKNGKIIKLFVLNDTINWKQFKQKILNEK